MLSFDSVNEMSREEWLGRRAEVRRQMNELAMVRNNQIRNEKRLHNENLKKEYDRHGMMLETIESEYRAAVMPLRDEMDLLSHYRTDPQPEGGAQ